jgi:hypothetical protein
MRIRPGRTHRLLAAVSSTGLLSFGGRTRQGVPPHRKTQEHAAEVALFVGGSTFVGHGVIAEGSARLTLRHGMAGFATLFVSVAGEVRGVVEALAGDDGSLVVTGPNGFEDVLTYLEAFGATTAEIDRVAELDPRAGEQWVKSLALRGYVEPPSSWRLAMAGGDD